MSTLIALDHVVLALGEAVALLADQPGARGAFGAANVARGAPDDGPVTEAIDVLGGAAHVVDVVVGVGVSLVAVAKVFPGVVLANLVTLIHAGHGLGVVAADGRFGQPSAVRRGGRVEAGVQGAEDRRSREDAG